MSTIKAPDPAPGERPVDPAAPWLAYLLGGGLIVAAALLVVWAIFLRGGAQAPAAPTTTPSRTVTGPAPVLTTQAATSPAAPPPTIGADPETATPAQRPALIALGNQYIDAWATQWDPAKRRAALAPITTPSALANAMAVDRRNLAGVHRAGPARVLQASDFRVFLEVPLSDGTKAYPVLLSDPLAPKGWYVEALYDADTMRKAHLIP